VEVDGLSTAPNFFRKSGDLLTMTHGRRVVHLLSPHRSSDGQLGECLPAGSDTPNPCVSGTGLHEELALPVKAGLMRAEALWAATVRPAEFPGGLDRAGSLTPGKDADLVLLDGDQLADITNTRRLSAVILKGKLR
jgi:predicted amidohydrolase YtcJ